jgi:predicted DNA-binding protein
MAMVRKQIYIEIEQQRTLRKVARQTGKTEAEIIRNALDEHVRLLKAKEDRMSAWREIEATVDRRTNPSQIGAGRTWKREDLYDRDERSRSNRH